MPLDRPRIIVMSRTQAEQYRLGPTVPHAIISIRAPSGDESRLKYHPRLLGTLRVIFDDVEQSFNGRYVVITPAQADQIVEFARRMVAQGAQVLICHCEAGVSRSAAVAAALAHLFRVNYAKFLNFPYMPNSLVYQQVVHAIQRSTSEQCVATALPTRTGSEVAQGIIYLLHQ